jgi:hypothetical protein
MSRQGNPRKKAIRDVLGRLGLQARPSQVVAALAARGVRVSTEAVRGVVPELL